MNVSFKRKIKNIIVVILLIVMILLIKYKIDSNLNIVSIKEQTATTSILEVKAGSKIINKQKNTPEEFNTKSKFFQKEIIEINTKDITPPDNIKDINSNFFGDGITIDFLMPQDNGSIYEYIIQNNDISKNINIYSNSGFLGYSYKINTNEKDKADTKVNKVDNLPLTLNNININKNNYLHIRTFDKNNNYSESKSFKINLPSNGINVKYVDINTNKEIASPEKISGMINEGYDVSNMKKQISDYTFVKTEGNLKGLLERDSKEIKYEYTKNNK